MASPIKYIDVYLYTTNNIESTAFRSFLDANHVQFTNLNYTNPDGKQLTLDALSTWFDDPSTPGEKIQITSFPVLVFEKVFWESEDGEEKYQKRAFALAEQSLPADFLDKAPKVS